MPEQQPGTEKSAISRRQFLRLEIKPDQSGGELAPEPTSLDHSTKSNTEKKPSTTYQEILQRISENYVISRRTAITLTLITSFVGITDIATNGLVRKMFSKLTDGDFWTKLFESVENGTLDEDIQQLLESLELKIERRFSLGEEASELVDSSLPVEYRVFRTTPLPGQEAATPQLIAVIDTTSGTAQPYTIETEILNGKRFALADQILQQQPSAHFMTLPGVQLNDAGTHPLFPAEYRPPEERDLSVEYPARSAIVALSTGELKVMTATEAAAFLNDATTNDSWQAFEMCLATIDSDNLELDLNKINSESVRSEKNLLLTPNHTGALATFYDADGSAHTLALGTHFALDQGASTGSLGGRHGISMLDLVYICQDVADKEGYVRFVVTYSDPGAQDNVKIISEDTNTSPDRETLSAESTLFPYELLSGQAIPREFRTSERFTSFFRQLVGETAYGTQLAQQQGIIVQLP